MRNSAQGLPRDRSSRGTRDTTNAHRTSAPRELNARAAAEYRNLTYVRLTSRRRGERERCLRACRRCAARSRTSPTVAPRRREKLVRDNDTAVPGRGSAPKSASKNRRYVQPARTPAKILERASVRTIFGRERGRAVVQRATRGRPRLPYLEVDVTILGKVCQIW